MCRGSGTSNGGDKKGDGPKDKWEGAGWGHMGGMFGSSGDLPAISARNSNRAVMGLDASSSATNGETEKKATSPAAGA